MTTQYSQKLNSPPLAAHEYVCIFMYSITVHNVVQKYKNNYRTLLVKLKFHGTDTDTDTDFLAAFHARIPTLSDASAFPREYVRWGCTSVHVYKNYAIGASLMSSVSVSVPWGSSLTTHTHTCTGWL